MEKGVFVLTMDVKLHYLHTINQNGAQCMTTYMQVVSLFAEQHVPKRKNRIHAPSPHCGVFSVLTYIFIHGIFNPSLREGIAAVSAGIFERSALE